jgi:signal transduction histidine kinase/CheY-like chemotaxis protein
LTREISLNNFESSFHSQITGLLAEIEKDITQKTALTNYEAEQSISKSIRRILGILACFFVFLLIILLLLLEDVTKSNKYRRLLEQAKKEAERQSRYWQRFLSNMSHELRTPLQLIIGYAEQLKKQGKPQEEVAIIHDSSEHLLQVINEILDYNRISSGKFGLNRMPFNLHQVLTEVLSMVHIHAARKGLQLSSNIEELNDGNYFTGDPVRLKQILLNLLGNAIKFTQKGQVQLQIKSTKCEDDNHLFTFRVKDTGPGIPPDMQRVIFQRFETLDTIANQQYNGSGLGLSITKALIEVQGGTMILESEEGKGSCFTFQLKYPVAVAEHISMPSPSPSGVHSSARVWVVDDDPLILRLCSSILNAHNIDSKCFPNGSALLNQHSGQQPSVFLIDIRMFDMNGFELYKSIRSRYGSDVPVIAITAQALPEELEEILRHGFNDILLKPFKEEELLIMINKWSDSTAATIKQMPFNTDQEYAEDIWEQYVLETTHDIHTLEAAADGKDIDTATMMLHRIAGRTAQVGNKELGRAFRKMELNVRSSSRINLEELQELIARLRSDLQQ